MVRHGASTIRCPPNWLRLIPDEEPKAQGTKTSGTGIRDVENQANPNNFTEKILLNNNHTYEGDHLE